MLSSPAAPNLHGNERAIAVLCGRAILDKEVVNSYNEAPRLWRFECPSFLPPPVFVQRIS